MNLPPLRKCVLCNMDFAVEGTDYCSLECSRWSQMLERFKKLEGILIEIKYVLKELNDGKKQEFSEEVGIE